MSPAMRRVKGSSAGSVHMNGWQRSFQLSMTPPIAALRPAALVPVLRATKLPLSAGRVLRAKRISVMVSHDL